MTTNLQTDKSVSITPIQEGYLVTFPKKNIQEKSLDALKSIIPLLGKPEQIKDLMEDDTDNELNSLLKTECAFEPHIHYVESISSVNKLISEYFA